MLKIFLGKVEGCSLNRFCIDEDAACELSGVYYLKESSTKLALFARYADRSKQLQAETKSKGEILTVIHGP